MNGVMYMYMTGSETLLLDERVDAKMVDGGVKMEMES